jgi:serine/threonine protein kinase
VGSAVGEQFEEYRIVEEIGRGGMGVVYRAIQETLGRTVALKMILTGEGSREEDVQLFLHEAAAVARLRHRNIVTIYELDVHEGIYYYTMDYIDGRSLQRIISEDGLEARLAVEIAVKVAGALEHAHRRGIVHRDLKPANVIIDEDGEPVITDFGLAFSPGSEAGPRAVTAGTPGYMAPEQVAGRADRIGAAVDVYALGAVLYTVLCGEPPFAGLGAVDFVRAVTSAEVLPVRELRPEADPGLCAIVERCLRRSPGERPASAAALAGELSAWL